MSLAKEILSMRKQLKIESFKDTHPEVYEWFNSDYFKKLFVESLEVSLRWEHIPPGSFKPKVNEGLPFKDSVGGVDIYDVEEYLEAEGFVCKVEEVERGFTRIRYLNISLEKEKQL